MNEITEQRLIQYLDVVKNKTELDWFGIFLFGSQNYGMDSEKSDFDAACFLFPPKEEDPFMDLDFIYLDSGEEIDLYDARHLLFGMCEGSILLLEFLYTDNFIINPKYTELWNNIRENKTHFIKENVGNVLKGIQDHTQINMRYFIEQSGAPNLLTKEKYYLKPVIHLIRMNNMLQHIEQKDYANVYRFTGDLNIVNNLRAGKYSFKEAEALLFETYREIMVKTTRLSFFYPTTPTEDLLDVLFSFARQVLLLKYEK